MTFSLDFSHSFSPRTSVLMGTSDINGLGVLLPHAHSMRDAVIIVAMDAILFAYGF